MRITILNGSPRKGGNTAIMAEEFKRGAEEAGHQVTVIDVCQKKIGGCLGCQYCHTHNGVCIQKDDMNGILEILDQTDLVAFASPVYWFDITGQLKCTIDRLYARGKLGYCFSETVLLLDSASEGVYDAALAQYKAMCDYLGWTDRGIVTIAGMDDKGSMRKSPKLEEVYQLGKSL